MKKLLPIIIACIIGANIFAQNNIKPSVFDLFETDSLLEMTLKTDYQNLLKSKFKDEYQPAILSFKDETGTNVNWEIELKPRGKMRRKVCNTPPLKLKFPKDDLKEQGLSKYHTLEMVEICQNNKNYEQFVLREYVAYKLYNMVTQRSFRVQLARVVYENTGKRGAPPESFAYIIENNDNMAKRLGGHIVEAQSVGKKLPNTQEKEVFAIFQYMIGNTDWYYTTGHNLDVFLMPDSVTHIPIPYDFDYAGFVNTPYSVPNDRVPIKNVMERFYMGPCRTESETKESVQLYLNKKEQMLSYCEAFPYFNRYSRRHTLSYLKSFFNILENHNKLKYEMMGNCGYWDK
jgi:hypothetical protein